MIVSVESNFVLELAFLQEEHESCLELLSLAESRDIHLVLPAFSIGEPYGTWKRRSKQRLRLLEQLNKAIRELARSKPYQGSPDEFQEFTDLLLRSGEEEKQRLDGTLERILQTVEVIPIGLSIIRDAIKFRKSSDKSSGLSPQDSIVYASTLDHLTTASEELRCFITKDSDFVNPDIENELTAHHCKLLTKFEDGLGYVRSQL